MKTLRNTAFILLSVMFVAYGCYPGGGSTTDDFTVVKTQYNTSYDFGEQKYYYIPDSMLFQTNIDEEDIDWDKYNGYETKLLAEVNAQMESRGYIRELNDTLNIDLVVLPSAMLVKNTGSTYWPGGGWWGGYYPPGWGGGGGWYYPPGYGGYWTSYSYTTGTVFITIADFDSYTESNGTLIELEWDAAIDGLFEGVNATKISPLVNQAFEQSPYLLSK